MQYITKIVRNIWKIIILKLIKSLFLIINVDTKNFIFCYMSEQSHSGLFLIAMGIILSSGSLMYWFKDCVTDCNKTISMLDYDVYINDNISLEDARLCLLAKEDIVPLRNGAIVAEVLLTASIIIGIALMIYEYNEIRSIKARKFAQDLKQIRTVLL